MNVEENPIDPDKVTETPGTLAYPHHVGSGLVKPIDEGRTKGLALSAMESQTDIQLKQIYEQMQLLAAQAQKIQDRKTISELIYQAEMKFEPLINHIYHLYQKSDDSYVMSLIGPEDWGKRGAPFYYKSTIKLLADHTWEILNENKTN